MRRIGLIGLLTVLLLNIACGSHAESKQLTRVVFARGHGSTWGSQFRMEVCPAEVSYLHQFRDDEEGRQLHELYAVPITELQWQQIEEATMTLLPMLQEKNSPNVLQRLAQKLSPTEVDGGNWWSLTLSWDVGGKTEEVQYIWPSCAEADAFELLLEELALTLGE